MLALGGCTGQSDGQDTFGKDPSASGGAPGSGGSTASAGGSAAESGVGASGGSVPIDVVTGTDVDRLPDGVPASSRVLRLSYAEYDRTLSDLLYLPVAASLNFPEELPNLGPYENHAERTVNERLYNELTHNAEVLAERVVTDAAAYQKVVVCAPSTPECRDQFIEGFGLRAFRRPLSASERTRYRSLFDEAAELVASGDPFRDGVRLVLEAMLQSPHLLYRIEVGSGMADGHGLLLSQHEIATRLSYLLHGAPPDAELLAAASENRLSTPAGIAEQGRRLAAKAEFGERVLDFHRRWMQLDELESLAKDAQTYPEFSPELVASMRAEALAFIEDVTLSQHGTVADLLTAPVGFVDARLASVYGLPVAPSDDLVRVEHAASSERLGLFTQAAFLSGHSSSSLGTSPILRGVFLLRRVACEDIPDPPPGAQMQEPDSPPAAELRTTRDYFSWKTSMPACAGCHLRINPAGFAFERFDGIGRLRSEENGAPIDATGTLELGQNMPMEFQGARELLQTLSTLDQVRACYAKNWLQYAYGRRETQQDLRTLGILARDLSAADFGVADLLIAMTARPAFSHLPAITE
ncbi:MAG TPA: DUF1592 domain-containing protein [Polyangiaceae bacterium]|nr:DUF1592 domain-containing protein [Polyangiaceae bacterium]